MLYQSIFGYLPASWHGNRQSKRQSVPLPPAGQSGRRALDQYRKNYTRWSCGSGLGCRTLAFGMEKPLYLRIRYSLIICSTRSISCECASDSHIRNGSTENVSYGSQDAVPKTMYVVNCISLRLDWTL